MGVPFWICVLALKEYFFPPKVTMVIPKTQTTLHLQTQIQTNHHLDLRISGLSVLFYPSCRGFWWLWCSPWGAGRAMSAWCWWRVWAGLPVCSWISCPHHQGGRWDPGSPVRTKGMRRELVGNGDGQRKKWAKATQNGSGMSEKSLALRGSIQNPFPAPPNLHKCRFSPRICIFYLFFVLFFQCFAGDNGTVGECGDDAMTNFNVCFRRKTLLPEKTKLKKKLIKRWFSQFKITKTLPLTNPFANSHPVDFHHKEGDAHWATICFLPPRN